MKKASFFGFLLALFLVMPAVLHGETPAPLPEVKTYEELCHAISQARAASRVRVEKAAEQERVREAWEIGRLIDAHVLQHKERADYAKQVLPRLAADLGMSDTELYRMLQFYRVYQILATTRELSWGQYRELISVNDPKEREAIASEAVKNKWSQKETRKAIRKAKAKIGEKDSEETQELLPLSQPGKPGTYKIILAKTGPYAGELALDLGFSNYISLAEVAEDTSAFKEGDIVQLTSPFGKGGLRGISQISPNPSFVKRGTDDDLYTYKAWVHRVLDGDTIEAVVDLGFGITTTQTLRFRGIDAPELVTADGMEAKKALEKFLRMADGKTTAPVLIKTVKSDKYDRYLVDVYITDKDGKQQYINNVLLEQGLAVKVQS